MPMRPSARMRRLIPPGPGWNRARYPTSCYSATTSLIAQTSCSASTQSVLASGSFHRGQPILEGYFENLGTAVGMWSWRVTPVMGNPSKHAERC